MIKMINENFGDFKNIKKQIVYKRNNNYKDWKGRNKLSLFKDDMIMIKPRTIYEYNIVYRQIEQWIQSQYKNLFLYTSSQ